MDTNQLHSYTRKVQTTTTGNRIAYTDSVLSLKTILPLVSRTQRSLSETEEKSGNIEVNGIESTGDILYILYKRSRISSMKKSKRENHDSKLTHES